MSSLQIGGTPRSFQGTPVENHLYNVLRFYPFFNIEIGDEQFWHVSAVRIPL